MKRTLILLNLVMIYVLSQAQGYKVGDQAMQFKLKNVDGNYVSSEDYKNVKGFILVFTCNECPYSKAYEERLIELNNSFEKKGFPLIAINPNDPEVQPSDTYELMVKKAKDMKFNFPYLFDPGRKISEAYGATRTPHVYLVSKTDKTFVVEYIGAIDDNSNDESKVTKTYLSNAINALLEGKKPDPNFTKAIGCGVKKKA